MNYMLKVDSQLPIVFPEIFPVSWSCCSAQRQVQDLVFLCAGLLHNMLSEVWIASD
jgi:hypothetical protein